MLELPWQKGNFLGEEVQRHREVGTQDEIMIVCDQRTLQPPVFLTKVQRYFLQ